MTITIEAMTFHDDLFHAGFPAGSGPGDCKGACCSWGVYVDPRERDVILEHRDLIIAQMDETQNPDPAAWFESEESEDPDFPSGRCVGTEVFNNKCVFLNGRGWCSLQMAATADGRDRWSIKPFYCVLFPLEVSDGVVGFDDMLQGDQPCCSLRQPFDVPLLAACRDEIVYLVGEEGYERLEAYARSVRAGDPQKGQRA